MEIPSRPVPFLFEKQLIIRRDARLRFDLSPRQGLALRREAVGIDVEDIFLLFAGIIMGLVSHRSSLSMHKKTECFGLVVKVRVDG